MAVIDYNVEMLKDKGIITGTANYYYYPSGSLPYLSSKVGVIPPLDAVVACYYYPYIPGDLTSLEKYYDDEIIIATLRAETDTTDDIIEIAKEIVLKGGVIGIFLDPDEAPVDSGVAYYTSPIKIVKSFGADVTDRILFSFSAYPSRESVLAEIGHSNFDWRNEGKLYQYPYRYFEFNDGLMNPMYIEPQYLPSNTNNSFKCRQYLNPHGSYECYVDGYKGDFDGLVFPNEVSGLDVPVANNAYLNYLNDNKNQRQMAYISQAINMASGVAVGAAQASAGNVVGGATTMANSLMGPMQLMAKENDLKRIPNSLSLGGMYQYALQKQQYMYKTTHRINTRDMERIALFFHMYGYQQNKMMIPDIHNRLYWNYIKCGQCNLKGNGIPKEQLTKLKQIFESGTTIWHIDNNATVGDYSKDNLEVY